jgi:hypothetical protein
VMTSNKIRYVVGDLHCSSQYIPDSEDPRFCSKQLK